jgi:hypothetical protein
MSSQSIPLLTHLMWSNGTLLCSEQQPEKVWRWPWPETITNHPQQWPEVHLCETCLAERQHPGCSTTGMKQAA